MNVDVASKGSRGGKRDGNGALSKRRMKRI